MNNFHQQQPRRTIATINKIPDHHQQSGKSSREPHRPPPHLFTPALSPFSFNSDSHPRIYSTPPLVDCSVLTPLISSHFISILLPSHIFSRLIFFNCWEIGKSISWPQQIAITRYPSTQFLSFSPGSLATLSLARTCLPPPEIT